MILYARILRYLGSLLFTQCRFHYTDPVTECLLAAPDISVFYRMSFFFRNEKLLAAHPDPLFSPAGFGIKEHQYTSPELGQQ